MFKRVKLAPTIAILTTLAGPALSADLDDIIYAPMLPETQPVEIGSGWYLRGDIGYTASEKGAATGYSAFAAGPTYTATAYDSSDLKTDWSGSLGVGYAFTEFLRADATIEFGSGRFSGTSTSADPCPVDPVVGTSCVFSDDAGYKAYGLMANAYFDLGTFAGFTPYVGGGLGMTQVRWDDVSRTNRCVDGGTTCAAAIAGSTSQPGYSEWRFTYALMAGLSYDITENLKLDVGYRYQNIDSGPMFGFDSESRLAGASGVQAYDRGFETHEIRAGLRYELW